MKNENYIYGAHAVLSVLIHQSSNIEELYVQAERFDEQTHKIVKKAKQDGLVLNLVQKKDLDALVGSVPHQGVVAKIMQQSIKDESDLMLYLKGLNEKPFLLILDGVQDPHNLGACLRTADAAGVHAVILPKDNTVSLNATVRKVACGAAEKVPVFQVVNISRLIKKLKEDGIWFNGATEEADETLYETNLTGSMALVIGSENVGIRRLTKEQCDTLFHIPMKGYVSSLNMSVATGICLFEAVRQRKK